MEGVQCSDSSLSAYDAGWDSDADSEWSRNSTNHNIFVNHLKALAAEESEAESQDDIMPDTAVQEDSIGDVEVPPTLPEMDDGEISWTTDETNESEVSTVGPIFGPASRPLTRMTTYAEDYSRIIQELFGNDGHTEEESLSTEADFSPSSDTSSTTLTHHYCRHCQCMDCVMSRLLLPPLTFSLEVHDDLQPPDTDRSTDPSEASVDSKTSIIHRSSLLSPIPSISPSDTSSSPCPICHEEYGPQERRIVQLPCCKHAYHRSCVERWMNRNPTCPTCRTSYLTL
ncbi:hypothetical protein WDU94_010796 [Cyamophila willieti]